MEVWPKAQLQRFNSRRKLFLAYLHKRVLFDVKTLKDQTSPEKNFSSLFCKLFNEKLYRE
jgi:hypothetical protein